MKKLISDLMIINKIIIFIENLIDEDIDISLFSVKIIQDIEFINSSCNAIFDEYVGNNKLYESDNFMKLYFQTLKRFHRLLLKVIKDIHCFNNHTKGIIESINTKVEIQIQRIKDFDYRKDIIKVDKQLINEEEYNLLLKGFI